MADILKRTLSPEQIVLSAGGEIALENTQDNLNKQRRFNRRAEISILHTNQFQISDTLKVGDILTLKSVLFRGGTTEILPQSNNTLADLAKELKLKGQYNFEILGHVCCIPKGADAKDSATGHRNLSLKRAETVYTYLVEQGIDKARLSFKGMGSHFPTGKGEAADRRVELKLVKIEAN